MKERMKEAKEEVESEQQNKLDISSGKQFISFAAMLSMFMGIIIDTHVG